MHEIDWTPPPPRKGLNGYWDQFIGPGATQAEQWVQLGLGVLLAVVLLAFLFVRREALNWSVVQVAVVVFFAVDLFGGVVTNATAAAKRWYHREGHDNLRGHLPFIVVHGIHLVVFSAAFRGMDWAFVIVLFGYLLAATVIVARVPLYLQRPIGMALFCGGYLLGTYLFVPTVGTEWFVPIFFLKLLVSHLLKEAPFRA
jgi:hypothetical protein